MLLCWPAPRPPNSLEVESVTERRRTDEKGSRFSEEQIIGILREAEAGAKTPEVCRRHGISDATFYIYGRLPRGKKALGPGLAVIDCKHLSGVTT
jgi:putative transposase